MKFLVDLLTFILLFGLFGGLGRVLILMIGGREGQGQSKYIAQGRRFSMIFTSTTLVLTLVVFTIFYVNKGGRDQLQELLIPGEPVESISSKDLVGYYRGKIITYIPLTDSAQSIDLGDYAVNIDFVEGDLVAICDNLMYDSHYEIAVDLSAISSECDIELLGECHVFKRDKWFVLKSKEQNINEFNFYQVR